MVADAKEMASGSGGSHVNKDPESLLRLCLHIPKDKEVRYVSFLSLSCDPMSVASIIVHMINLNEIKLVEHCHGLLIFSIPSTIQHDGTPHSLILL